MEAIGPMDAMNAVRQRRQLHTGAEKGSFTAGRSFASKFQSAKSDEHYPISTGGWDNPYVPFFGPPMAKNKLGMYDDTPKETDNLPDAYEGQNQFLMSTMDFMITENDEWVTRVLPWFHTKELHVRWQEFKFNRTWPDLVPEQAPSRYITHSMETREAHLMRRGMAFIIEWGFFNTDIGKSHYIANFQVIRSSVLTLVYYSGIFALLTAKDHYREKAKASPGNSYSIADVLQTEYRRWAIMQKEVDAWLMIDKDADALAAAESVKFDTWIVPVGMASYANQIQDGKLDYSHSGPQAASNFNKKAFKEFRGKTVHEVKDVDADFMDAPTNLLKRERCIGDHWSLSDSHITQIEKYRSDMKSTFIFNMDSVQGTFSKITQDMCLANCSRFGSDGKLSIHHHDMIAELPNLQARLKYKLNDDQVDMFVVRDLKDGVLPSTGLPPSSDGSFEGFRVIQYWGEMYPRYFNDSALIRFAESCRARIHRYLTAEEISDFLVGEQLAQTLSNSNLTRELGAYYWAIVTKNGVNPQTMEVIANRYGSTNPAEFISISADDNKKYLAVGPDLKDLVVTLSDFDINQLKAWEFNYISSDAERIARLEHVKVLVDAISAARAGEYRYALGGYSVLSKVGDSAVEFFRGFGHEDEIQRAAEAIYSDVKLGAAMGWYTPALLPFGYGNWPGMRTLSWLYQNSNRMGYDEKILQQAHKYVKVGLKIAAQFGSIFYGTPHAGFDEKYCPVYHKTYDRAVDSITAFMTNVLDSSKLPVFVRMAESIGRLPEQTPEVDVTSTSATTNLIRDFKLAETDQVRLGLNTLITSSATFRYLTEPGAALVFSTQFDSKAGADYCAMHGIRARVDTFKHFLENEVLKSTTNSGLREFDSDPSARGSNDRVFPAASVNLVSSVVNSIKSRSPLNLTPHDIQTLRGQSTLPYSNPPQGEPDRVPVSNEEDVLAGGVHLSTRPQKRPGDTRSRDPGGDTGYDATNGTRNVSMVCTRLCIAPAAFHVHREIMQSLSRPAKEETSAGQEARAKLYKNYWEIPLYPANPANPARPLGFGHKNFEDVSSETRIRSVDLIVDAYDQFMYAAASHSRRAGSDSGDDTGGFMDSSALGNNAAPYFDAFSAGTRRPDPIMYTAPNSPFVQPGGLEFNEYMVTRFNFASANIKDPISRAAAYMYVLTEVTAQQLQRWGQADVVTPVDYLGERPFKRYYMGSVIACKAGYGLGATMYGHEDFQVMVKGDIKVIIGNFTINHATIIKNHRLHLTVEDVYAMGYLGGEGVEFFDGELDANTIRQDRRSIIMCMLPYGSTRNAAAVSTNGSPPLRVMSPHSLLGQWESRDFLTSIANKLPASSWLDWHYESLMYYNYLYKFNRLQSLAPPETFNFANCPSTNLVTWQAFQYIADQNTGAFTKVIANQDPFGKYVYTGCKAVRCGDSLTFDRNISPEAYAPV